MLNCSGMLSIMILSIFSVISLVKYLPVMYATCSFSLLRLRFTAFARLVSGLLSFMPYFSSYALLQSEHLYHLSPLARIMGVAIVVLLQ